MDNVVPLEEIQLSLLASLHAIHDTLHWVRENGQGVIKAYSISVHPIDFTELRKEVREDGTYYVEMDSTHGLSLFDLPLFRSIDVKPGLPAVAVSVVR